MSGEQLRSEDIYIDRYDSTSSEYDSDADREYMPNINDFSDSSDCSLSMPKKRHTSVTTNNVDDVLSVTHETLGAESSDDLSESEVRPMQILCNGMPNSEDTTPPPEDTSQLNHIIMNTDKRSRCSSCYERMKNEFGRGHAVKHAKQVKTMCPGCNPSTSTG
ncbi:hypothetical protein J6590_105254 [Homalodisca vitripennis]|nr:hypothetical protein J6590_105254 [Homalodisca vitripennis]